MVSGSGGESLKALRLALDVKRPRIQEDILLWAASNNPRYPWRQFGSTPYQVFIGEFWLREVPPEATIQAYNLTLQAFPSFEILAGASVADVAGKLASAGLEEQSRNLKSTVERLRQDGKETLPADSETYLETCGLENHAVKAIMGFGYGMPVSVVDANVSRLLLHVFSNTLDALPRQPSAGFIQAIGETLLPGRDTQRYNGALLDVAEQYCRSEPPRCGQCPLVEVCDYAARVSRALIPAGA